MLSEPEKIRVEFSKTGALKFISHLDLNRTVQTAFLRSKLPIWYTQGFNPHPKTVFSPPLPVGVSSECEFMDFKMTEKIPYDEVVGRLNDVFPEGLRALCAYAPQTGFSEIRWAEYLMRFMPSGDDDTPEKVEAIFRGAINVEKTGKAGTRSVDISPDMHFISCGRENGELVLCALLSCAELTFVGPYLPVSYIAANVPELSGSECSVHRRAVLLGDRTTPFR